MADRLNVDPSTWEIYNNSKIMGYNTENKIGRKEQFFVALGLGYKSGQRTPIKATKLIFLVVSTFSALSVLLFPLFLLLLLHV